MSTSPTGTLPPPGCACSCACSCPAPGRTQTCTQGDGQPAHAAPAGTAALPPGGPAALLAGCASR
jgi:hypothetical protein